MREGGIHVVLEDAGKLVRLHAGSVAFQRHNDPTL